MLFQLVVPRKVGRPRKREKPRKKERKPRTPRHPIHAIAQRRQIYTITRSRGKKILKIDVSLVVEVSCDARRFFIIGPGKTILGDARMPPPIKSDARAILAKNARAFPLCMFRQVARTLRVREVRHTECADYYKLNTRSGNALAFFAAHLSFSRPVSPSRQFYRVPARLASLPAAGNLARGLGKRLQWKWSSCVSAAIIGGKCSR